jgi:hypothetical protein
VFAPALAREKAVRGIVVFGALATRPPAYPGRSERFFTEFDAVDVPAAWAAIDTRPVHLKVDTTCCTAMKTVQADVGEVQLKADTT